MPASAEPIGNALLAALPDAERALLRPVLERVPLGLKQMVQEIGEPIAHLWFPRSGVLSLLSAMEDGSMVEVATIGREGMAGVGVVLGTERMAHRAFAQIVGEADRLAPPRSDHG